MGIKILISRKVSRDQEAVVKPFLAELHSLAWRSKGYISGEALENLNEENDHMVISSWQSMEDWENFRALEESIQLHYRIDQILGHETVYKMYRNK